jgi:chromosome segregation ATPase
MPVFRPHALWAGNAREGGIMSTSANRSTTSGNGLDLIVKWLREGGESRGKEVVAVVATELLAREAEHSRLQEELEAAKRTITELSGRVEQLEKERKGLMGERDQYLRSLHALLPKPDFTFTEEELRDLERNGVTLDELIKELEAPEGRDHG